VVILVVHAKKSCKLIIDKAAFVSCYCVITSGPSSQSGLQFFRRQFLQFLINNSMHI